MYTQIVKDAINKEVNAIKEHSTEKERENLNLAIFNPKLPEGCLYGQLFGGCHSHRAKHMLNLCAVPYSSKINEHVEPTEKDFHQRRLFQVGHHDTYSIVEFAIFNDASIRPNIIGFLKSEATEFKFV